METILKLENIRKSYGKKEVLKGVSLDVKKGEIISVLGPSGCGKSTMLNIIAGILSINDGRVILNGKEVTTSKYMMPIEKRDLNMVFQDFALWPHMTARQNILYGLKLHKTDQASCNAKLEQMVSLLHLNGLMDQYPAELSGGQQQRVAIARALVMNPAIVLLDEPLCNLDVQLRIEMRTEMAQIFRSLHTTVFHVTHDPSEAFAMADRIVVMNNGMIDQIASPKECYEKPATAVVAGLLGAGNCIHGIQNNPGDITIADTCVKALSFTDANDVAMYFRPEDVRFSVSALPNSVPIEIIMPTFEGGQWRIKAKTSTGEFVTFLHPEKADEGTHGYLGFDANRVYAYESITA